MGIKLCLHGGFGLAYDGSTWSQGYINIQRRVNMHTAHMPL